MSVTMQAANHVLVPPISSRGTFGLVPLLGVMFLLFMLPFVHPLILGLCNLGIFVGLPGWPVLRVVLPIPNKDDPVKHQDQEGGG